LQKYYYGTAQILTKLGTEQAQAEWNEKHNFLRHIIHSVLSADIRKKIRYYNYDRNKYRGKDIVDLAEKSLKLISRKMDMLYDNMLKDLYRSDYVSWVEFML
jgi:dihydroxyacetone kinase-like predicted kinase